jgi:hypothetical protein
VEEVCFNSALDDDPFLLNDPPCGITVSHYERTRMTLMLTIIIREEVVRAFYIFPPY